jgi:hypothetical protein
MASGLTHILLTKKLQDEFQDGQLKDILAMCADSFLVGAIAPDIPYASIVDDHIFSDQKFLADHFHYKQTNQIPLQSLIEIKKKKGKFDLRIHFHMFSFFLGYISHVFADGIIHPFVRDMVGDYDQNKTEHRKLEMQLDVLFLAELTKKSGLTSELNYSDIHDELENFGQVDGVSVIVETFGILISTIYNEKFTTEMILGWVNGLHRLFAVAEGEHPKFFRGLNANTFLYENLEDIDRDKVILLKKPSDRPTNFLNREEVDFFKDCIPQYFTKFVSIAQKAYDFVYEDGPTLDERDIPEINLDTGRLLPDNNLNMIPELWK